MRFLDWHIYIILAVIWVLSLMLVRRKRDGDSAFMRLFQSNEDLDTTLDKVLKIFTVAGIFGLVVAMIIAFHDDIADKAGMALISAIGMISLAMRDMFPGRADNGKS